MTRMAIAAAQRKAVTPVDSRRWSRAWRAIREHRRQPLIDLPRDDVGLRRHVVDIGRVGVAGFEPQPARFVELLERLVEMERVALEDALHQPDVRQHL